MEEWGAKRKMNSVSTFFPYILCCVRIFHTLQMGPMGQPYLIRGLGVVNNVVCWNHLTGDTIKTSLLPKQKKKKVKYLCSTAISLIIHI